MATGYLVPLFCAEAALSFWTEQSERNWLNSHLAVIGVPQCERDFKGRWRITSSADEVSAPARMITLFPATKSFACFCKAKETQQV